MDDFDNECCLTIFPYKLVVCMLKSDMLPSCAHAIIRLLLVPDSHKFVSITCTDEDITLIVDEESFAILPQEAIEVVAPIRTGTEPINQTDIQNQELTWSGEDKQLACQKWCGIHISEGSAGFSGSVVASLSARFASAAISIFYLATTETDYILVPESMVYEAIECLKGQFTVMTEGLEELSLPPQKTTSHKKTTNSSRQHRLALPPLEICLCSIQEDMLPALHACLLSQIFFPTSAQRFVSYTDTEDEWSLIADTQSLSTFPSHVVSCSGDKWRVVKVADGPLGFEEAGIVASVAGALARASSGLISNIGSYGARCDNGIPLFYISTFLTDYALLPTPCYHPAVKALRSDSMFILP